MLGMGKEIGRNGAAFGPHAGAIFEHESGDPALGKPLGNLRSFMPDGEAHEAAAGNDDVEGQV